MTILGVESSGNVASVAMVIDGVLVGEYTINNKKTHSQTLLDMISQMIEIAGVDKQSIDAVAISAGPGSFTGLRIGAATAKGLAQAWGIPVISVPTIPAMAYNLFDMDGIICPIMDARRNQVYTGAYRFKEGVLEEVCSPCATDFGQWLDRLNVFEEKIIFLGDGIPVQKEHIEAACKSEYRFAPGHVALQRAGSVAMMAYSIDKYEKLGVVSMKPDAFSPEYFRKSQAEREREEREKENA